MCRLFAQVASRPSSARDLLAESGRSLLRQSEGDPRKPQKDGWGLAWFGADGKPRLVKSGRPVAEEAGAFRRAAGEAVSPVVLGHIRAASNPHLEEAYAHPFEDEGWVFIHNGTLTIAPQVAAALGPRRARLKTDSDSEIYFQQFLKHLAATGEPAKAFEACVAENWRLWESCASSYPDASTPYTSLNAIASDGRGVHALCHASRAGMADCAVFEDGQPWSVMSFREEGGRFVLASEPVDAGAWTALRPPETLDAVPGRPVVRRPLDLTAVVGHPVPEVSLPWQKSSR